MNKVLIIGAGGYIGRNAVKGFQATGDWVCWGADILPNEPRDRFILLDRKAPDFGSIFAHDQFDLCINCSGAASVPESFRNPHDDYILNTVNVARILEAIRLISPKTKFLNLSSAAVYGNPLSLPITESAPTQPLSPYGAHKLASEAICDDYWRYFGVATASVRIFSAYGPGMKKQILWDLYQKSLAGGPVELSGTGDETRDFIFVDDVVAAMGLIFHRGCFEASVFNLASGRSTPIRDLAEAFLQELGFSGGIRFNGKVRVGDPAHWAADVSRLEGLGFAPRTDISKGLKVCAQWLKDNESH